MSQRLQRAQTGLLVVDIQDRLLPAIHEKERMVQNTIRLAQGAGVLKIPVFVTEQYRKGLGATAPEVAAAIPGFAPIEKTAFSACGAEGLRSAMASHNVQQVLVCGIESHVCVLQTCLDLLEAGLRPFVVADAVSSRTSENCRLGLQRMHDAGAVIASTEMVLFELLGRSGTEEFKAILPLVK
jgi:nicotinamidase-related amidase